MMDFSCTAVRRNLHRAIRFVEASLRFPGTVLILLGVMCPVNADDATDSDDADPAAAIACDILLVDGLIIDGSGAPGYVGDVAIQGDRIVAVGEFEAAGTPETIDCEGLVIAPGFIDLHSHSDDYIDQPQTRANINFVTQGCTTIVTGNCGFGPVAVGAYYDRVDSASAGSNVAHLLPHGSLREEVMGTDDREPTAEELAEMLRLSQVAMDEGAWGMSTGLIYVPGTYSQTDELVAVAEVVGRSRGIYVSHMRDEGLELLASVEELLEIGRRANVPVHASHFKSSGRDAWGLVREAARMIEQARAEGQVATADQYPYIASSTSLEAVLIPTWARAGGDDALLTRFDDAEIGARLREEIAQEVADHDDGAQVRIARFPARQEWVGKNLLEIAGGNDMTVVELVEYIVRNEGAAVVNFGMNEDDVRAIMQFDWVATASDGRATLPGADRPHPRFYGTFPRKIGYYAQREGVLPVEQAIRSATSLPAEIIGFEDRGTLAVGQFADVVVFDPELFIDEATYDDPHRYASGLRYVWVNGVVTIHNGHPTGALAGKSLRHVRDVREE